MKKIVHKISFEKLIRVLTVAPLNAVIMMTLIFIFRPEHIGGVLNYVMSLVFLLVLPLLGYPLQRFIPYYRDKGREGQRNLAILTAIIGYVGGFIYGLAVNAPDGLKIIFLTYLLSVTFIFIGTKFLNFKPSGHTSGITGMIVGVCYFVSPYALFWVITLALAVWASLKMKRHTALELFSGVFLTVLAFFCSVLIALVV